MNAIWLTHIANYKNTKTCFASVEQILNIKNQRREILLKKYGKLIPKIRLTGYTDNKSIMLAEGRIARLFWKEFVLLVPSWCNFHHRCPGLNDTVNQLLDLGYHHLTNIVRKNLETHDISPALGILHVARKSNSAPLAYDLVEMFRADAVESEVLRFLHLKKRPVKKLCEHDTAIFISKVNQRLNQRYFIKSFGQCQTYRYYMELQILKFVKAVNHKEIFKPLYLPTRHDTRCTKAYLHHRTLTKKNNLW